MYNLHLCLITEWIGARQDSSWSYVWIVAGQKVANLLQQKAGLIHWIQLWLNAALLRLYYFITIIIARIWINISFTHFQASWSKEGLLAGFFFDGVVIRLAKLHQSNVWRIKLRGTLITLLSAALIKSDGEAQKDYCVLQIGQPEQERYYIWPICETEEGEWRHCVVFWQTFEWACHQLG